MSRAVNQSADNLPELIICLTWLEWIIFPSLSAYIFPLYLSTNKCPLPFSIPFAFPLPIGYDCLVSSTFPPCSSGQVRSEIRRVHCGAGAVVGFKSYPALMALFMGCLVASHSLPQLTLGKCGKPQKVWLANWLPHFAVFKGILPHFLTL